MPETLELVGLDGKGDRMPDELSGGEQQRVAIARAFVNRPMILIADEPTGNLDPTTSVGIMKLLDRINRTGTTVVMATHDAGVVDQMRKRVIELEHGQRRPRPGPGRLRLPALTRPTATADHRESLSMQLRYVFSELGQGLRRNLSMHLAVILTLFVSLTLVGLGVLLNQQADKAADHWGSQLQITVWLCKDRDKNAACTGEVTDAQKQRDRARSSRRTPRSPTTTSSPRRRRSRRSRSCYGPGKFDGPNPAMTAEDMPESLWIELKDPDQFEGITSAVVGLDGVSGIRDMRETLKPIYGSINALKWGALGDRGRSWCSRRCCWWPTPSGSRRSPGARRSGSCGWSAPRRSTSRCRSCSRPWSPRCIGVALAAGALGAFM